MPNPTRVNAARRSKGNRSPSPALWRVLAEIHRSLATEEIFRVALRGAKQLMRGDFAGALMMDAHASVAIHSCGSLGPAFERAWRALTHLSTTQPTARDPIAPLERAARAALRAAAIHAFFFYPFARGILIVARARGELNSHFKSDVPILSEHLALALENAGTHAEIRDSEVWHRAFIENSLTGFWEVNARGVITFVNRAAAQILGYAREELIGMPMLGLTRDFNRAAQRAALEELQETGKLVNRFGKVRCKDGKSKSIYYSARLVGNSNGDGAHYQAIFWDETEQHQVLQMLARRNQELDALNAIAQILSKPLEIETALAQVCQTIAPLLGMETANFFTLDPKKTRAHLIASHGMSQALITRLAVQELAANPTLGKIALGKSVTLEDPAKTPHLVNPILFAAGYRAGMGVPIKQRGHSVGALIVGTRAEMGYTQTDINFLENIANQIGVALENAELYRQMQARVEEIEKEKNTIQAILDSNLSGLYVTDRAGRFILFNRAAEEMTGWTFQAVQSRAWEEIFPVEDAAHTPLLRRAIEKGATARVFQDRALRTRAGARIPVAEAVAPLRDGRGNIYGAVGAFWDQSRELKAEETQEYIRQTMAHELGSALTKILPTIEILENSTLAPERRAEMWQSLKTGARALKEISDQFLEKERARRAPRPLKMERLALDALMRTVLNEFWTRAGAARFVLRAREPLPIVYADRFRVETILRNLIENAIKYSPPARPITVRVRAASEARVEIAVCDQGNGIPRAERAAVLKPFYRGEFARRRNTRGYGLGLAIVAQMIGEMGERLKIARAKPKGTIVQFTLRRLK